jgi:hypothetical protein
VTSNSYENCQISCLYSLLTGVFIVNIATQIWWLNEFMDHVDGFLIQTSGVNF